MLLIQCLLPVCQGLMALILDVTVLELNLISNKRKLKIRKGKQTQSGKLEREKRRIVLREKF